MRGREKKKEENGARRTHRYIQQCHFGLLPGLLRSPPRPPAVEEQGRRRGEGGEQSAKLSVFRLFASLTDQTNKRQRQKRVCWTRTRGQDQGERAPTPTQGTSSRTLGAAASPGSIWLYEPGDFGSTAGDWPTADPGDADAVEGGACPSIFGVGALEVMLDAGTLGCAEGGALPATWGDSPPAAGLRCVAASLALAAAAKLKPAGSLLAA